MKLSQFRYNLPQELIALYPSEIRDATRSDDDPSCSRSLMSRLNDGRWMIAEISAAAAKAF